MSDTEAPDLDAELLALADGDSSDEETAPQPTTAKSPSPQSPGYEDDAPTSSKPPPKKSTKTKRAKKMRRDDSEEEGEASSDQEGEDSAPMSESDGGAASPGSDGSGPIFPIENKYYSEKDKSEILALPEIEREAALAERAALLERKHQDNILKRLYEGYKDKGDQQPKTQQKRKAGAADLEDGDRKSSRQRTRIDGMKHGETNSSLENYKREREQKGILAEQRKADAADRKANKKDRRRSPGDSDADGDAESEVEWDDKFRQPEPQLIDEPAELIDYNRVFVGRANFAQVCFYPGFEDTMRDCYIRVNIGGNPASGESLYRMAKIVGISQGKPYAMEGPNGKKFITYQYARCTIGKKEREYPFIFCSMTKLNQREVDLYKAQVVNDAQLLPKKSQLNSKCDQINRLINYQFNEAELQEKLKRSGVLKQRSDYIEKTELLAKREDAERDGNQTELDRINNRLKELEPPKLAFGTSLYAPVDNTPRGPTQQERLAELNRQNRKANTRDVRKAQIAEMRARNRRVDSTKKRDSLAPGDATASGAATPSSPGNANTPNASQSATESVPKKTPPKGGFDWAKYDPMAALGKVAPGGGVDENGERKSVFKRKMCDDEILANMDFGLDLDIEAL